MKSLMLTLFTPCSAWWCINGLETEVSINMPQRRQLCALDRGRALAWLQEGISMREVGRRLGVSHSVVSRLQERVNATGSADVRPRSGRPRCTSRRDDRFLMLNAVRERTVSAPTLRRRLRAANHVNVSERTVRNRLHEFNLRSRSSAVRIPLLPQHRVARVNWCRIHQRWNRQQWARVLFTDESRFTVSYRDGRRRVWRRQGERYLDGAVQEVDRYGGGSVMVWGAFHANGVLPLHVLQGTLTGVRYRDEILQPLVQPALQAMGAGALLQDDNATPHRARVVTDFVQQQGIQRLPWPARSPDLAPIEHLWDLLGRRVRDNHPPPVNVQQLTQFLLQEWQAIPRDTLRALAYSMRNRCRECLVANGGHNRY